MVIVQIGTSTEPVTGVLTTRRNRLPSRGEKCRTGPNRSIRLFAFTVQSRALNRTIFRGKIQVQISLLRAEVDTV